MIRLDTKQEIATYNQLELFPTKASPPLKGEDLGGGFSPNNETAQVPILTDTSPSIGTPQVPNMGHPIKPNIKQKRETPTHEIFNRNKKIQNSVNDMAGVPKLIPESLSEVEEFFKQSNYPATEAKKFYNHYKALGWKIQGKTPIEDWRPLIEKWMANAKKWDLSPSGADGSQNRGSFDNPQKDLQYLYDSFLEGKNIFQYLLPEHFDQLKLELNEIAIQEATKERIGQLTGVNKYSVTQLLQAYLSGNPENELILKDKPNLIALAKRIAVIKYFDRLKQSGSSLSPAGGGSSPNKINY